MMERAGDRRIFGRLNADLPVRFGEMSQSEGNSGILQDLSAEGAKLVSRQDFTMNEPVSLVVNLPDGHDPVILKGSIIWIEENDKTDADQKAGIRFNEIQLMNMHRLMRFCQ